MSTWLFAGAMTLFLAVELINIGRRRRRLRRVEREAAELRRRRFHIIVRSKVRRKKAFKQTV